MPIHYEDDAEHVVVITIDRPEARNAADMEHFKLLREAWERFAADDQAWVAIVTGVGEAFFAGADLKKYVPEITKFQKEIAEQGLTEINGYRLDDGTRAVLRNWPLYKPVDRGGERVLHGGRHGDARRLRHPRRVPGSEVRGDGAQARAVRRAAARRCGSRVRSRGRRRWSSCCAPTSSRPSARSRWAC